MNKKPNILIVNDDGIESHGIVRLAAMAANFGDVWVAVSYTHLTLPTILLV